MGSRRISRETALQFLYQEDFTIGPEQQHCYDLDDRFELFCSLFQVNKKARDYAKTLLGGISANLGKIDELIGEAASNWRVARIAATDRNLLRIAIFEMIYAEDVPAQVAINEAVEIAKRFAGTDSPKFINGILDAILTRHSSA
ncbi:transcription antitermination factor NusB [Desulforhopalus singaporensis]|uniref:Transcription antitermination protein NusB n=1 Tax=Desulforhopalus singaporensis TaxID=91360 RepID=A0A1H0RAB5_9BACT|nr:transcription antitermination factor NusB [Desulforhopalus singaporensis]SDP25888.1 NusB antitermination factor [Desulforhopalus singaporensis]